MKKNKWLILVIAMMLIMSGCGKTSADKGFNSEGAVDYMTTNEMPHISSNDNSMTIYMEGDTVKNYEAIKELLQDSMALVKVEVTDFECRNVRSYIYTSYQVKVDETLYGNIDNQTHTIIVNLPGGVIEGERASSMIKEVTEDKDAGDLSEITEIVSNGNTERLLEVGDTAYLFLIPESEDAYAVVGEYVGVIYVDESGLVIDKSIEDGKGISEEEFRNIINTYR